MMQVLKIQYITW